MWRTLQCAVRATGSSALITAQSAVWGGTVEEGTVQPAASVVWGGLQLQPVLRPAMVTSAAGLEANAFCCSAGRRHQQLMPWPLFVVQLAYLDMAEPHAPSARKGSILAEGQEQPARHAALGSQPQRPAQRLPVHATVGTTRIAADAFDCHYAESLLLWHWCRLHSWPWRNLVHPVHCGLLVQRW
jgi:hypothetical protein